MKKTERLTPEQELLVPKRHEEWLRVGLSTEPMDFERAKRAIGQLYSIMGKKEPHYVACLSPMTAELVINVHRLLKNDGLGKKMQSSLWDSLEDSLGDSLGDSLWDSLWDSLGDSLGASLQKVKLEYTGTRFWGSQDSYWVAFYKFCEEIGVKYDPKRSEQLELWAELARSCSWWYAFENKVFICDRPSEVHFSGTRLHRDGGMCVKFRDGWGFWALNGRRVPEWVACKPTAEWTKEAILGEKNTEVRREIIRKLGDSRAVALIGGKVVHERDYSGADHFLTHEGRAYELLEVDFGTGGMRRYLKMQNASVADVHIEPVAPECETVDQALGFRDQELLGDGWKKAGYKYDPPVILT